MSITRILANCTVADLAVAQSWYTKLFGRGPDANPMAGLIEWHLDDTFGLQVWSEPERAGRSSVVLDESDLDALVTHLNEAGIANDGPVDATSSRILPLADPDGNRVVFTGAFS